MSRALESFLNEHPLIESIDLLLPDLSGVPRGKRLGLDDARAYARGKGLMTTTIYALDTMGANVDKSGLVWEEGDADRPVYLDESTIRPIPWRTERASIIGGIRDHDGSPYFADPRAVLAALRDRLRDQGINPVVAIELEFYLLDAQLNDQGMPQVPVSPRTGRRPSEPEVFLHERFDEAEDFFDLLDGYCDAQGLPVKGAISEFAPGQFEVNLNHVEDAVQACDDALMFKRCVKAAARAVNRQATFMAKPFEQQSGNGLHVHTSLTGDQGRNLFGQVTIGDKRMRHCIWGLQETMAESVLLMAPNANSYRRLQAGSYAPINLSWGMNNRTVALRIPAGSDNARRIEHRIAGADANPYLVVAAIFAGMLHGLDGQGDPGEPVKGNAYERKRAKQIPTDWSEALRKFEQATILPGYLGPEFCKLYAACRRAEFDRFEARISPLEVEWYLSTV